MLDVQSVVRPLSSAVLRSVRRIPVAGKYAWVQGILARRPAGTPCLVPEVVQRVSRWSVAVYCRPCRRRKRETSLCSQSIPSLRFEKLPVFLPFKRPAAASALRVGTRSLTSAAGSEALLLGTQQQRPLSLFCVCAPGLEAVLARELEVLLLRPSWLLRAAECAAAEGRDEAAKIAAAAASAAASASCVRSLRLERGGVELEGPCELLWNLALRRCVCLCVEGQSHALDRQAGRPLSAKQRVQDGLVARVGGRLQSRGGRGPSASGAFLRRSVRRPRSVRRRLRRLLRGGKGEPPLLQASAWRILSQIRRRTAKEHGCDALVGSSFAGVAR